MHPADPPLADLRSRVLQASVELLEQQGVAGLSMREVARRAGVSHQAPYHHFADRAAILGAIAEEGFNLLTARLGLLVADQRLTAFERLEQAGIAYVEFAIAQPAHFRVMFRPELVDMEACKPAKDAGTAAFGALQEMVRRAVAEGLDLRESPEAAVTAIWSMAHGLACLLLDGPLAHTLPEESKARTQTIQSVMRILRRQLEANAGQR